MKAPHRRSKFLLLAAISCAAIFAATVRRGKRVPAAGTLSFTPGAVATQISTERKTSAADERHLGEVEAQQEEFEAK